MESEKLVIFPLFVLSSCRKTVHLLYIITYNLNQEVMRVISSSELRNNMKKYLDLAVNEKILIQRGKNETFVLARAEYLEPDEDLRRAISAKDLLVGVEDDIRAAYREKYGKRA